MKIYDAEQVLRDLEQSFKDNLNTEIAAVNAEKADALTIVDIPDDKYVFMTLDERMLNFKGFWFQYGLMESPPSQASPDNFREDVTVTLQVACFDQGDRDRSATLYRLLRYQRAIKQVILKNPDLFQGYSKPLVQSLEPAAYPFDNKLVILSIGVNITVSITAN
ncbi:MAG: hypothetical protein HC841_03335 [Verrucomicrobiae bacterium]|nr:hypothetical protein [Verrucomicrobiae bacterium]